MEKDLIRKLLSKESSTISDKNSEDKMSTEQADDLLRIFNELQELIKKLGGTELKKKFLKALDLLIKNSNRIS